jgi:putative phage-type endonuclease
MIVVDFEQRSPGWKKWRSEGVTASDAVTLLGRNPYKTYWRLWAEKSGYVEEDDLSRNPNVIRGVEHEDDVRMCWEDKHDDIALPLCAEYSQNRVIRASFDGLGSANNPAEFKCPCESAWISLLMLGRNSELYQLYYPQIQVQMLVADAKQGYLCFWFEGDYREFLVDRDDVLLLEFEQKAMVLIEQVRSGKEPEKDPERDSFIPKGDIATQWANAATRYTEIESEIEELQLRISNLKKLQLKPLDHMKSLLCQCGHKSGEYAGIRLTRYKVKKVNYSKLIQEKLPDVDVAAYENMEERYRVTVTSSLVPKGVVAKDVVEHLAIYEDEELY